MEKPKSRFELPDGYWQFIEKFLPGYYQDSGITLSNDLEKYVDGELDYDNPDDMALIMRIHTEYGSGELVEKALDELDIDLFKEAVFAAYQIFYINK